SVEIGSLAVGGSNRPAILLVLARALLLHPRRAVHIHALAGVNVLAHPHRGLRRGDRRIAAVRRLGGGGRETLGQTRRTGSHILYGTDAGNGAVAGTRARVIAQAYRAQSAAFGGDVGEEPRPGITEGGRQAGRETGGIDVTAIHAGVDE